MVKQLPLSSFLNLRLALVVLLVEAFSGVAWSQLVVNNATTPQQAVQNILLGDGVTASNITFQGMAQQVGSFNCANCNLGLQSGIVLGSGNVSGAQGPNNSGSFTLGPSSGFGASDPDLQMLSGFPMNDRAVLTFDFIPTGDSLVFRFVFGSDEYPEYSGSGFNDAFGFFLSGPGISGPFSNNARNLALIPGTNTSITINNLNNGGNGVTGPCNNCAYYIHNGTGGTAPFNSNNFYIQADGFTHVITAYAQVQCGQQYRIKLAIADAGDTSFDSWVFLEAGSFQSNQLAVAYTGPSISPAANGIYEGCQPGILTFTRPPGLNTEEIYTVTLGGTATPGVDYADLPEFIVFPPMVTTVTIPVYALSDDEIEGTETIVVMLEGGTSCTTSSLTYTLEIFDLPPLNVSIDDVVINCGETVTLSPNVSGGVGYQSMVWSGGIHAFDYEVSPLVTTTYQFTVFDTCGVIPWQGSVTVSFPDYDPIQVDLGGDQLITCLDSLTMTPVVTGGYGAYQYVWSNAGMTVSQEEILELDNVSAGLVTLVVTDGCGSTGSGSAGISFTPIPVQVDLGPDLSVTCLDEVELSAAVSGGVEIGFAYQWLQDGGVDLGTDETILFQTPSNTSVQLLVTDICGNQGADMILILVPAVAMQADPGPPVSTTCVDPVQLIGQGSGGVGTYSYTWLLGNQVLSTTDTVTYLGYGDVLTLQMTDQCGNSSSAQVPVLVPPVPVIADAGPDVNSTCIAPVSFQAQASGGVGSYTYQWFVNSQSISQSSTASYLAGVNTNLTVVVTDQCGNTSSDVVALLIPPVPVVVDAGPDQTSTCVDPVTFQAQASGGVGNFTYQWTVNGQSLSQTASATYTASQTTPLTVTAIDQCGNVGTDVANLVIPGIPVTVNAGPDQTTTCLQPVILSGTANGGVGSLTYSWTSPNGVVGLSPNVTFQTHTGTVLTFTAVDVCGNVASDQVFVSVPPVPVQLSLTPDTILCFGQPIMLVAEATGGVGNLSYLWPHSGSEFSIAVVSPGVTTAYSVQVEDECGNDASGMVVVAVDRVEAGFTGQYVGDFGVELTNVSLNGNSYMWFFGDGTTSNEESPTHQFYTMNPWVVTLEVTGSLGCTDTFTQVFRPEANIYIPNTFTPNGDYINDVFKVEGHDIRTFRIVIFNRWGETVYTSESLEDVWDGSHQGAGHYVPDGVYSYRVEAHGIRGNVIQKTGWIMLIR